MRRRGWFADTAPFSDSDGWQPCLETGAGHVPCFDIWFKTEQECMNWIREYALDAGMLDD